VIGNWSARKSFQNVPGASSATSTVQNVSRLNRILVNQHPSARWGKTRGCQTPGTESSGISLRKADSHNELGNWKIEYGSNCGLRPNTVRAFYHGVNVTACQDPCPHLPCIEDQHVMIFSFVFFDPRAPRWSNVKQVAATIEVCCEDWTARPRHISNLYSSERWSKIGFKELPFRCAPRTFWRLAWTLAATSKNIWFQTNFGFDWHQKRHALTLDPFHCKINSSSPSWAKNVGPGRLAFRKPGFADFSARQGIPKHYCWISLEQRDDANIC
jgi:hypothetical protein